jgi:hypothetical protein
MLRLVVSSARYYTRPLAAAITATTSTTPFRGSAAVALLHAVRCFTNLAPIDGMTERFISGWGKGGQSMCCPTPTFS